MSGIHWALAELSSVLSGEGDYECHFPDGSTRRLTYEQLHTDLKASQPEVYAQVRYRWVRR